ncbi:MAG TPA: response regulator transcription factor [Nocardioides sp.]|nr:response regulator transcription factor [Nocardioides sp.]
MLADDAVLFREGMARILEDAGLDVAAQAATGPELLAEVRADPPDVAVVDLRMPPGFADEGIEVAAEIRRCAPSVGVLILSQYVEAHHALRLMTHFEGGVGYLLKERVSDLAGFVVDVRRVADGQVVMDPELVAMLVARPRQHDPLDALTARERAVLELMARGLSNQALSQELFLSPKTVEGHVRSIFGKLGLEQDERENRRVLAVLRFLRQG